MIKLRDYQDKFVAAILAAWTWCRAVLGVLPTGAGKTVCFSAIIHEHNGAAAAVVHRKEIVGQISLALARLEVKHRIIAPSQVVTRIRRRQLKEFGKSFIDPHAQVGVISVQTLTSGASDRNRELQRWLAQITLAVFDEGHHYVEQGLWAKAVLAMENAKLLFVTATPERADGKGLGVDQGGFAETMVEGPSMRWLQDNGYLCSYRGHYYCPDSDLDVSDIPLTASGELNTKEMRKRIVESHLVGDVVKHYQKHCPGKRAIVFANDVETAEEMARAYNAAGIPAAALSGETDAGERDAALDKFESGELLVLVNVDLFDEGFDVPAVEAVILGRLTESLAKYLQMVGRALRVIYAKGFDLKTREGRLAAIAASEKPFAAVIDPVRNWERHGMPNWPRKWTLDRRESKGRSGGSGTVPQRVCLLCTQPYERYHLACPYCGEPAPEPAGRSTPDQVEGDLHALDDEALLQLFLATEQADISDEDFALGLYKPNEDGKIVPPKYHGRLIRKHQEDVYRRKVLRELVAWWVGCHPPGRPMSEIHKRFYFRFGVDIGTPFTPAYKAADIDALIERIKRQFSEDLAA